MEPAKLHLIIALILTLITAVYAIIVYRRDLMMLQQNSYRNERYTRWINSSGETTRPARIIGCIALFLILVYNIPFGITGIISSLTIIGCMIYLSTRRYKKPLVMTRRAWRILLTALALDYLLTAAVWFLTGNPVTMAAMALLAVVASPFIILAANWLLTPVEKSINRKYYNEARDILASMPDLKIIGITGSYGKTSTKHYLHRILSEQFDTLMTPGSFNTTMGVIRTVREYLKPYNEVFIVEMGAKQPGDIKEICDLVHPEIGIVTAVGEQHLESFKSIENVQLTKFELIDALPANGLAVLNDDFPYVANRPVTTVITKRYSVSGDTAYVASDINYDANGTTFSINGPDGLELTLHTHLVGECNISNLIGAVIVALHLGVPVQKIQYAVEKIEQVEHRLNVKRTPGGLTIIDDAFNSNPDGSRMAVDVLARMKGGKRIIITPGMIELGAKQYDLNRELGRHIGLNVDIAIIVGEYNRDALVEGILETGKLADDCIYKAASFNEAQGILTSIARAGDTVLYENDLPDTFK
ncbi:MAG: UDP-N-acetylmuramoyl-tripeptide--D-alanyl-D-alanine ligase [Bacteroidales bacterium]|nr:UDP-N-acetylmuramoyl-tripeptide--D-alanyl-D-alanine ligase [Bacteroidales bacterium]